MPSIDRQEADRLLTRLLELPSEERSAALESACDDAALRRAVLRLLRAAEEPGGSVDPGSERSQRLWTGFAARAAERETPLAEGAVLGSYRILEEIDRGGMAVVYRAERVDGEFTREVAVKVLKLGFDSEEVVRRFEQERQILADLDHPSIARMFDGGRTEEGRPYVVMELVEGQAIDRYCDARRLTVEERLELFCVVAGAVEYAHQKLVVHRDLKPSNILVTETGQVKLLDFGIARLVDVEAGDGASAASRTRLHMMTPEYASPEQVRGERVATTSDVYQLGLLLYRLLSGRRPYAPSERSPDALARAICEQEPPRPSTAILREPHLKRPTSVSAGVDDAETADSSARLRPSEADPATPEAVSHARRTTPSRLRRRLRGDLDGIVLQALRKAPSERYPSAEQLARDIRRHRAKLPVTARADTALYRTRRFLARHALGATATALALLAAAGVAGFHTARIRVERDRAQAEAAKAEQMNEFLTGMFRSVDPRQARGEELTARELLDRGVEQADRELADQPIVQASMLHVLGRTYMELGIYDSAEGLLRRAIEVHRDRLGPRASAIGEVLRDLGVMSQRQGRFERARDRLEEASRILAASPGGETADHADVLGNLGLVYRDLGRLDDSLATLERALSIQLRTVGEDSEETAWTLDALGMVQGDLGRFGRAEELHERALAIQRRRLGADNPRNGWTLTNLAVMRKNQGKLEGLEPMYRRSLEILEGAYGPDRFPTGWVLNNLGDYLIAVGRHREAIDVLERALEVYAKAAGPDHPASAIPLVSLGDAHFAAGRLREARPYYRRGAEMREKAVGKHPFDAMLAHCLVRLGRIDAQMENHASAEELFTRARMLWRRAPDVVDSQLVPTLFDLGRWLVEREHCSEAVPLLRRARRIEDSRWEPASSKVAEVERLLTACAPG